MEQQKVGVKLTRMLRKTWMLEWDDRSVSGKICRKRDLYAGVKQGLCTKLECGCNTWMWM